MIETLRFQETSPMTKEFRCLLNSNKNKEIDKNFDIELCKICCKYDFCISDFRNRPLPTETKEYRNYRLLSKEEKQSIYENNKSFYDQHIGSFLDMRENVKSKNQRNRETLAYWLGLNIPRDCRIKIEKVLDTFSEDIKQPDWQKI